MMRAIQLAVACVAVLAVTAGQVQAGIIAFYNDGSFVDTSREAPNLQNSLTGLGHTVNAFSGTTNAQFSNALMGADVLVIPELENGDLFGALDATTRSTISDFVDSGGGVIVAGDGSQRYRLLLNGLFGYSLNHQTFTSGGSTTLDAVAAAGTPFADDPLTLSNSNATARVTSASLPAGSLNLYHDTFSTSVFANDFGSGRTVFLGFDWFDLPTPSTWNSVLDSSVAYATNPSVSAVPEPSSLALFGIGAWVAGLGAARRRCQKHQETTA